jgi:L-lactate dehydrogenase complex protein LldF
VPRLEDIPVFMRLLARSATGQPVTAYTTHLTGPDPRRAHQAHLVIVDNGRSKLEADQEHRSSLSCIRCGACMNTCPIYRRTGGHSYGWTIPGPIGAVLAPSMIGEAKARDLPYASTLCGSCTNVCPVRIDLHEQLISWRARIASSGNLPWSKRFAMRIGALVLGNPHLYALSGYLARKLWPLLIRLPFGPVAGWTSTRELPTAPPRSFRASWQDRKQRHG